VTQRHHTRVTANQQRRCEAWAGQRSLDGPITSHEMQLISTATTCYSSKWTNVTSELTAQHKPCFFDSTAACCLIHTNGQSVYFQPWRSAIFTAKQNTLDLILTTFIFLPDSLLNWFWVLGRRVRKKGRPILTRYTLYGVFAQEVAFWMLWLLHLCENFRWS